MLKKLLFQPGVNRESSSYAAEGGWYESDKVRFRQGLPEKIGGWVRLSANTYLGVCRSLWNWATSSFDLLALGTNLKFYIESSGVYNDITPIRATATLANPFGTTNASPTVLVTDAAHGALVGDYVTFSGASAVGGLTLNGNYVIVTVPTAGTYTITASSNATSTVAAGGGAAVTAAYEISPGPAFNTPLSGWGAGAWGASTWGVGGTSSEAMRIWSQSNFGTDLVFGYRGGPLYYWAMSGGVATRGVAITGMGGASGVPLFQNMLLVSDVSRFVFAFGTNDILDATLNAMLVRWSDQESAVNWTPGTNSQAGSLMLSQGSEIVTACQARQEILVWTDSALYALQFQGYPIFWGSTLLESNISIASQNAATYTNGTAFWMGVDKFYKYDGRVQTLRCDLRKHIFSDINTTQLPQVFCGTNEGFNEVWWFYCSSGETVIDRYVVYNYVEDIWYYGSMSRSAWLDAPLRNATIAATYNNNVVYHEVGTDDSSTGNPTAIDAYITSAMFDMDDGNNFVFVRRVLPDVSFRGSTASSPAVTLTLTPSKNAGSGPTDPESTSSTSAGTVTRSVSTPVEEFTGQVFVRVRGRQLSMKISSSTLGVAWQLGAPRMDGVLDGRK